MKCVKHKKSCWIQSSKIIKEIKIFRIPFSESFYSCIECFWIQRYPMFYVVWSFTTNFVSSSLLCILRSKRMKFLWVSWVVESLFSMLLKSDHWLMFTTRFSNINGVFLSFFAALNNSVCAMLSWKFHPILCCLINAYFMPIMPGMTKGIIQRLVACHGKKRDILPDHGCKIENSTSTRSNFDFHFDEHRDTRWRFVVIEAKEIKANSKRLSL